MDTSRRVVDGQRHAAMKGGNHGGSMRPFGWRKDRLRVNKREAGHIRREIPRILAGVSPHTLAREWNERGIATVTNAEWRATTIRRMYLNPRICGFVVYRGEVLHDTEGNKVQGKWETILTEEEHGAISAAWAPSEASRLGAKGRGYRTSHLLSPFIRCGKCGARLRGMRERNSREDLKEFYRCASKGEGGCAGVKRLAAPIEEYIKALVIAEQQKIQFQKLADLPPWPKAKELSELQKRIDDQQQNFEAGNISAERHFPSLARMEAAEAILKRERRSYEGKQQSRRHAVENLADEWDKPEFTMEQKQAAISQTLTAVILKPAGRGGRFHPDQIVPVFREDGDEGV